MKIGRRTVGPKEARAWTIRAGATAPQAAGGLGLAPLERKIGTCACARMQSNSIYDLGGGFIKASLAREDTNHLSKIEK